MTYCVGLKLNQGLVLMSDTRTNAGVDNVSVYCKMHSWQVEGDRVITLLSSGNLATSQSVISSINEQWNESITDDKNFLKSCDSMYQVARYIGEIVNSVILETTKNGQVAENSFNATFILAGQIKDEDSRLFLIYPEGNFIETSEETSFFQIGETKYGKPILVRAFDKSMSFEDSTKLLLLSFDSTFKSNLSVGLPLDIQYYINNDLKISNQIRIDENNEYYQTISSGWGDALKQAFQSLPSIDLK